MRANDHYCRTVLTVVSLPLLLAMTIGAAQAGRIAGDIGSAGDLDGWNTGNVGVEVVDEDGTDVSFGYDPALFPGDTVSVSYESFVSRIYQTNSKLTDTAVLYGKDYPIGAPPGLKVVNGVTNTVFNNGRPTNCIMTTSYLETGYLNSASPAPNSCDGPPKSHKRFKLNMFADALYDPSGDVDALALAQTPGGGANLPGIDLVFNVVEDGTDRQYQVYQKINNYTGARLQGFIIQVGEGTGGSFVPITDTNIVGLTAPTSAWEYDTQIANFAFGLFGNAAFNPHHTEDGFFDNTDRAALDAQLVAAGSPNTLISRDNLGIRLVAGSALASNYGTLPVANGETVAGTDDPGQFGEWLHSGQLPYGIFFDDDNDPGTEAQLVAFFGTMDVTGPTFGWMRGDADAFAPVDPVAEGWFENPAFSVGPIEDLVNVGLNYIVSVSDVTQLTDWNGSAGTFTLRVTPVAAADQTDPAYVGNDPAYTVSDGTVVIGPDPVDAGSTLYIRANDGDITAGPVTVSVTNTSTGEVENVSLGLVFDGVVQGELPTSTDAGTNTGTDPAAGDGVLYVAGGDVIRVDYVDPTDAGDTATATTTVALVPASGGGCALGSGGGRGDWTLPALLAAMLGFGLMRRRRQAFKA